MPASKTITTATLLLAPLFALALVAADAHAQKRGAQPQKNKKLYCWDENGAQGLRRCAAGRSRRRASHGVQRERPPHRRCRSAR